MRLAQDSLGTGSVKLTHCTVTGNATGAGGTAGRCIGGGLCVFVPDGDDGSGGGIFELDVRTTHLKNTILAGNWVTGTGNGPDCSGPILSEDYNLVGDNGGCGILGEPHDLVGTAPAVIDPVLRSLDLNPPGNTETHALRGGSPAIDAIPPVSCTVATDQRGVARPYGDGCDIGAYERGLPVGGEVAARRGLGSAAPWVGLVALMWIASIALAIVRRRPA